MNHVVMRRFALGLAAVSFGLLSAVLLVCNALVLETGRLPQTVHTVALEPEPVSLPFQVDGTALVVKNLAVYDGAFYEDGSGREVIGAAALVLQNSSGKMLRIACVELMIGEQLYIFECAFLPPFATVLIPEKNARPYQNELVTACTGYAVEDRQTAACYVLIVPSGMGSICVTNTQSKPIDRLTVYHKTYLADAAMYIGGVAFETVLPAMQPGEQVTVTPSNYASDYSQILAVEITKE